MLHLVNVHLSEVEMCPLVWKDSLFVPLVTELRLLQSTATILSSPEVGLRGSHEPKISQISQVSKKCFFRG